MHITLRRLACRQSTPRLFPGAPCLQFCWPCWLPSCCGPARSGCVAGRQLAALVLLRSLGARAAMAASAGGQLPPCWTRVPARIHSSSRSCSHPQAPAPRRACPPRAAEPTSRRPCPSQYWACIRRQPRSLAQIPACAFDTLCACRASSWGPDAARAPKRSRLPAQRRATCASPAAARTQCCPTRCSSRFSRLWPPNCRRLPPPAPPARFITRLRAALRGGPAPAAAAASCHPSLTDLCASGGISKSCGPAGLAATAWWVHTPGSPLPVHQPPADGSSNCLPPARPPAGRLAAHLPALPTF